VTQGVRKMGISAAPAADLMELRAADTAVGDFDERLAGTRIRRDEILNRQRCAERPKDGADCLQRRFSSSMMV